MSLSTKIRYKGEFNYAQLYRVVKGFFKERDYDFYETRYKLKGDEQEIDWKAERMYDEMHKVEFIIALHAWNVEQLQVVRYGKPETHIRARIEIKIEGKINKGYATYNNQQIFNEADRFDSFFKKLYDKLTHNETDEYWEEEVALELLLHLSEEIKKVFNMSS